MNIIVDTSVIISVITNEDSKPKIISSTRGTNLIAPISLHWEVGNAFSAMLKRKKIDIIIVPKLIDIYYKIPIKFIDVNIKASLKIANKYNIYAYDAYFLECAIENKLNLITLDERLKNIALKMNIKLIEV
ncbi:MAG: type II toxin-antitoxin system VapC family toxin [Ignavibacteriales bacterium]|nr:type II toxin-antitoxin system VapC family toxin [Ignavibacteriales bacterium]